MKVQIMSGPRTLNVEPPRSTAYYYADLERLKRKEPITEVPEHPTSLPLAERTTANDVADDGPIREVPPLRDRQWSLPEYHTPENSRKEETYSTAGTFPMPEPREKEPLLAELEVVGRLPLTQLETNAGVRRSRSWYLCCPNLADEEISRESSWRYSSLRPVTAPPVPGQNGLHAMVATQSSGREDASALRAERDSLARALSAERARSAAAARAHDARLAELHGVIAELVRRRQVDKHAAAIPEEEVSDECESTTQPAGELDNDADQSRTEQNDTSSLSPTDVPTPQEPKLELPDDTDTSTQDHLKPQPGVEVTTPSGSACEGSLHLSERDSELCLSTARCCQSLRHAVLLSTGGSCERSHGSADDRLTHSRPKLAARVRLRKTEGDTDIQPQDETWCLEAAERLALDVCAQADLREALTAANNDGQALSSQLEVWKTRARRLDADCAVLQCALDRATDTAHRLSCACALQESCCVSLCAALRAADRAIETYDVLLALAETQPGDSQEREAAESVARQLLSRLESEHVPCVGEPLLSPGPWLQHHNQCVGQGAWSAECERRLRAHAARLKAETVAHRNRANTPQLFSYHDIEDEELPKSVNDVSTAEMEAAVMLQEVLTAREAAAARAAGGGGDQCTQHGFKGDTNRKPKRRERHWLDTPASETDL